VLLIALIFAAILILPILFCLKSDGTLGHDAKWVAIWTPMWIVCIVQLAGSVAVLLDGDAPTPEANEEEGEPEPEPKIPLWERLYNFVLAVLFVLIQIFVTIRLDRYVRWSWFVVFIPWFLYEGCYILYSIPLAFFTVIVKPDYDELTALLEEGQNGEEEIFMLKIEVESQYFEKIMEQKEALKTVLVCLLRVWLAVFLALRVDHTVDWNWGLVLLPIWVYLFMQYSFACYFRSWGSSKLDGLDMEAIEKGEEKDPIKMVSSQQGSQLQGNATFLCFAQAAPLFMAILLVSRLEVSHITTFVIILPVFIALGCCCCVVFCGICLLSCVDMDGMREEMAKHGAGGGAEGEGDVETAGTYSPPSQPLGADAGAGNEEGSTGSADSTSPFQSQQQKKDAEAENEKRPLVKGTNSASSLPAPPAKAAAPAPVPPPAPKQPIEVDID
jgi:hypothetical protein